MKTEKKPVKKGKKLGAVKTLRPQVTLRGTGIGN